MTQEQMRQKAQQYIAEIHATKPGVELPELPSDFIITWETLGNLALILGGVLALHGRLEAPAQG